MDFLSLPISGKDIVGKINDLMATTHKKENEFLDALDKRLKQDDLENFKMKKILISDLFLQTGSVETITHKIVFTAHGNNDISIGFLLM